MALDVLLILVFKPPLDFPRTQESRHVVTATITPRSPLGTQGEGEGVEQYTKAEICTARELLYLRLKILPVI